MAAYLGIDIGTRESKGVLIDDKGKIIAMEVVGHGVDNPRPGWFSQDAEVIWWGDFCRLCRMPGLTRARPKSAMRFRLPAISTNSLRCVTVL